MVIIPYRSSPPRVVENRCGPSGLQSPWKASRDEYLDRGILLTSVATYVFQGCFFHSLFYLFYLFCFFIFFIFYFLFFFCCSSPVHTFVHLWTSIIWNRLDDRQGRRHLSLACGRYNLILYCFYYYGFIHFLIFDLFSSAVVFGWGKIVAIQLHMFVILLFDS